MVFLSPRSLRSLSLLPVGLVTVLCAGYPTSGWRCVLRHALVQEAVPRSHRLALLLRTGFLFSGLGLCGRRQPFPSHMYSFGMWSPFESTVSLSLLIVNEGLHWWWFLFRYSPPFLGVKSSHSSVLLQFVGTSCGWWPPFYLACHCTLPVGCLLLAFSAA